MKISANQSSFVAAVVGVLAMSGLTLQEEGTGTRLTVRHIGDTDDTIATMIRQRWPIKLQALASTLGDER